METGNLKNWVMVGLLGIIIVVLLTQPIIVNDTQLSAWTTDDGLWSVGDVTRVDEFRDFDDTFDQYSPDVCGDVVVYTQKVVGGSRLVAWANVIEEEWDFVYNTTDVYQDNPKIRDDLIVYAMKDGIMTGNYDIYMKNLETNHTNQLTNSTDDELKPAIDDDYVVYLRYDDFAELWCHDMNNATNYQIFETDISVEYIDIDEGIVAFALSNGDMYYYDFDTNTTTNTDVEDASYVSIYGDLITYQSFDDVAGIWTTHYYSIEADREYSLVAPDGEASYFSDIYDGVVVCSTEYSWNPYEQITIVDLDSHVFDELFVQFTNYTTHKVSPQIGENMIVWEEYQAIAPTRATSTLEHDVVFLTYEPVDTESIPQEFGQGTNYQMNWIYTLTILFSLLGATFILWVNEEFYQT